MGSYRLHLCIVVSSELTPVFAIRNFWPDITGRNSSDVRRRALSSTCHSLLCGDMLCFVVFPVNNTSHVCSVLCEKAMALSFQVTISGIGSIFYASNDSFSPKNWYDIERVFLLTIFSYNLFTHFKVILFKLVKVQGAW